MRKVTKLIEKKTVGYQYTTNDFNTFLYDIYSGILQIRTINEDEGDDRIDVNLTKEDIFMLREFFRYVDTHEQGE